MRKRLADKYIRGRGIEIGGLHCPLEVPIGALVTYVDRLPPEEAHPDVLAQVKVKNVVIDDAENLDHFPINSLDFIIANHVFEHCHNSIGTLYTWQETLRPGGIVFAAVPDKDHTFDKPRAVTKLQHLIDDWDKGHEQGDGEHYREWLSLIDKVQEPELTKRVEQCLRERANIHFHVWDQPAMREFLSYIQHTKRYFELVEFAPHGAEVIWILRKI